MSWIFNTSKSAGLPFCLGCIALYHLALGAVGELHSQLPTQSCSRQMSLVLHADVKRLIALHRSPKCLQFELFLAFAFLGVLSCVSAGIHSVALSCISVLYIDAMQMSSCCEFNFPQDIFCTSLFVQKPPFTASLETQHHVMRTLNGPTAKSLPP